MKRFQQFLIHATRGLFLLVILCFPPLTLSDDDSSVGMSIPYQQPLLKWEESLHKLESEFDLCGDECAVLVSIKDQELRIVKDGTTVRLYPISSSKYGPGNRAGSYRTPLGTHRIEKKIGYNAKFGAVFESRINVGRTARICREKREFGEDLKTTRILWLKGLEPEINSGFGVDTFHRLIYIHGTQEEGLIGTPASNGCIRMTNRDVMELFDIIQEGTLVEIYN